MIDDVTDTEPGVDPAPEPGAEEVSEDAAEPWAESLDDAEFRSVIEALLLVVDTPVTVEELASATDPS